ncbi:25463_t:CDS:2 [Dentiscutata erythropus]|uniref:25463_t:CDS:1 n=1 Tax=Dentiscutata erythropus TaxID=1348616 RepID=A0A9N9P8F2_9GLOM|nr:25463_t:CDS:2 [Dentiscutata erythropus]
MTTKIDSQLKNIIKQSKSKKELVKKLSQDDPEFLIKYFDNIERVAEIIYNDKKGGIKRKKQNISSSSEDDSTTEEDQPPLKKTRKPNIYSEFVKRESKNLVDVDNKDKFKIIAEMWKTKKEIVLPVVVQIVEKRKKKKQLNSTTSKKVKDTYKIGFCGDEKKLQACHFKRAIGVSTEKVVFGAYTTPFNKLELHNISIHLKITTYHNSTRENTINLPTQRGNTVITPLLSPMTIQFHIVEICNPDLAKKEVVILDDILLDKDLKKIQFKNTIKSRLKETLTIECADCEFTFDEIIICFNLDKLHVCLNSAEEDEMRIFDKANFAFLMIVDYMNWMYQFKRKNTNNNDGEIYLLRENFNLLNSNSGISAFFSGGYIEYAWRPDMKDEPTLILYY